MPPTKYLHRPFLWMLLLTLVLSGCAANITPKSTVSPTLAPLVTVTLPATATKPLPSATPVPSNTPAPFTYRDASLGISLQIPLGWQAVGENRYEGADGFFELAVYETAATYPNLDDFLQGGGYPFSLMRACAWELSADPTRYIHEQGLYASTPGRSWCKLTSGNTSTADAVVLLPAPTGGFAILRADAAHVDALLEMLNLEFPGGQEQQLSLPYIPQEGVVQQIDLHSHQIGALTVEEYRLFAADEGYLREYYPCDTDLPEALVQILSKHQALRSPTCESLFYEWKIDLNSYNETLALFGYRLETQADGNYRLYQDDALILENFAIQDAMVVDKRLDGINDFALMGYVAQADGTTMPYLLRKDGFHPPFDPEMHIYGLHPVFVAGQLVDCEHENIWNSLNGQFTVTVESEPVFTLVYPMPSFEYIHARLSAWENHWVLESVGTLVIDGQIMNLEWGYGEIFSWTLLDGQPFFFFEKDGKYGLSYAGQELPLTYEYILRGFYTFTLGANENIAWFYGLREGVWHYVEVGKFE